MKSKKNEVIIEKWPIICPHCNKDIVIRYVTIERMGQKILIPCCNCKGLIGIKIVGPLLSDFVLEKYNSKENISIEKKI